MITAKYFFPGVEGKAGMATIVDEHNNLDLLSLTRALQKSLPPFARPVFIRLTHAVDTTGIEIYLFNRDMTF